MTRDDIRKMAETAGLAGVKLSAGLEEMRLDMWERFAALVAAAEREACAKLCDSWVDFPGAQSGASKCAAAIRSRIEPPRVGD